MKTQKPYLTALIDHGADIKVEHHPSLEQNEEQQEEHDLSISRNWMEYIETASDHDHPSAYDVLRCDIVHEKESKSSYRIWGIEYHLNRLEQSYLDLLNHYLHGDDHFIQERVKNKLVLEKKERLSEARTQSVAMIHELLNTYLSRQNNHVSETDSAILTCEILKVTLLWSPPVVDSASLSENVVIRGHCSSSGQIIEPQTFPDPITATLALPDLLNEVISMDDLPDRHISPSSKISSWSSQRRPLEEKFMPAGIGEVLLLQMQQWNGVQSFKILEGLTSNFFAIYKDGTIRTESQGVLFGYIRHLVLEVAIECGLKTDTSTPILLEHANDWEECFITSSSRLIYPIQKILTPDYSQYDTETNDLNWKILWSRKQTELSSRWKQIYKSILKIGGYT